MRRYVVYGAGAVGGTLGARLSQTGQEVVLIARGLHHEAIAAGLRFESSEGAATLQIPVAFRPGDVGFTADDVIVLCMKSQDTEEALQALVEAAPASLPVLCAQNGVANERATLRLFPNVYGVRVNLPVSHLIPGTVRAHSAPVYGLLDIGRYPVGDDALATSVASDWRAAGFASRSDDSIMRWKYYKLLVNLQNAVDLCCGPGADGGRELYEVAREEGRACLAAASIEVATPEEERTRRDAIRPQVGAAVDYPGNSSWQSLARGQQTEVDYLNGEIVLLGRLHGVPTPANAVLQAATHRMIRQQAAPGSLAAPELLRDIRNGSTS